MIPRNVVKQSDIQKAGELLVNNKVRNNSIKYDAIIGIDGVKHHVAPKTLVSKAFEVATGEAWPVSKFSGGRPTNNFLRSYSVNVVAKNS
tara:strand:+ start:779 stop:1048 length:270 start_codon:yes stop_codon:yes gene_type:complete